MAASVFKNQLVAPPHLFAYHRSGLSQAEQPEES
jgi:hypothetical protein